MISKTNRSKISVNRESIKASDTELLSRYMGIKSVPCTIQSPLRDDDVNPSFSLMEKDGMIFWKDFGTGESGNLIKLFAKLWCVNYDEALLKLSLDASQRVPKFDLIRRYKGKLHITKDSSIKVRIREWKDWDVEYWNSYGISQDFCTWCKVFPISHAFFTREDENGVKRTIAVPMDKYAYAYFEWKDGKQSIKLYQPYSSTMKWLSKHDSSVWDLWKQAFQWADKRSDSAVIITSSRKDAMCLWQNLGVPAMSLQGEGYLPKPQVMKQVIKRFKTVYLWYDNDFTHTEDNPGQDNAKKLIELYPELHNIVITSDYKSKDPSDLVKNWGTEVLKDIWKTHKV